MLRPFDKTTQKRRGVGSVDENEAGTNNVPSVDGSFKDRALSNSSLNKKPSNVTTTTTTKKPDLFGRKKSSNQVLKEKSRSITPNERGKSDPMKTPWKALTPVKRPSPHGPSPVAKRLDSGPSEKVAQVSSIEQQHDDIEYGFGSEQESPYVPDDVTPIDFDDFDCAVNMDAYETTDAPLDEIDSFPHKRRHFQTDADLAIIDESDNDERRHEDLSPPSFEVSTPPCIDSDHTTLTVNDTIEYCPPREQELPYTPDTDPVDLTLFGSAVHLSAYDLSRYFDEQVDFLGELLTDDAPLDLLDDYGLYFGK
ncbi:hypothetical protein [Absidia glauca]|uniref:Uncharacterized protein n=1 Tax=Absidia glauca TaxID=4829 RepID=A0A163KL44_ABSGL|nr:hypothetical protein [Absidia glauca]